MTDDRDDKGRFIEGNDARPERPNLKHGGRAAVQAFREGKAFTGLAAQEEHRVVEDLEERGQRAMQEEIAVRLHTCTRLYYAALQTAVDRADLEALDRYAKRFGWLAGKTSKAWKDLGEMPSDEDDLLIDAALADARARRERMDNENGGDDDD